MCRAENLKGPTTDMNGHRVDHVILTFLLHQVLGSCVFVWQAFRFCAILKGPLDILIIHISRADKYKLLMYANMTKPNFKCFLVFKMR